MFDCTRCGHCEIVHFQFVGRCLHGEMKPKDGRDCNCPGMDSVPEGNQ